MNYTTKVILTALLALCLGQASGQDYSKRAVRFCDKAEELIGGRDFDGAKEYLHKSISIDPTYPKPYLRLATIHNLYLETDSAAKYYNAALDVMSADDVSQNMWAKVAGINYESGNYQKAKEAILMISEPDPHLLQSIIFSCSAIDQKLQITPHQLPDAINMYQLQYFPTLTVDEQTIIYTRRTSNQPSADEDLVISRKINGEWIPAQSISPEINTPYNEGASTISADGRTLIFTACEGRKTFGSCDLYISVRQGNKWSIPENLGASVNSRYWDSQPALSADGRVLYFASNRPGGMGKRDLWVSKLTTKGWSTPQNLGSNINTPHDETTPFIHVNGKTLFFSSEGHPGLGGFDLFTVTKHAEGWSESINLGYPINTLNDEISLFINASGTHGYYAAEKSDRGGILESKLVKFMIPNDTLISQKASYVTGRVMDEQTKLPLGATIRMSNLGDSTDTYFVSADTISGRYFLVLTEGNEYGVFVKKEKYLFEDLSFEPSANTAMTPDTIDIYLQPIRAGASIVLENIFFETDEYQLSHKSRSELKELGDFIVENPDQHFLIEGHTDNTGAEDYNMELSSLRAKTVYDFLVHLGVPSKLVSYRGFGSSKPLSSNQTPSGRMQNRRITITVVSGID